MQGRDLLKAAIKNFTQENLSRFFREANESFVPAEDDFSHYLDKNSGALKNITKIGEIAFDEVQRLIVIACRSESDLTSRSGKKRQYELAKKILKSESYDAGIFAFHDDAGSFRFSLVVAQYSGTKRTFSHFRRYTYFVSPDLPNKTFLNQIGRADFSSIDNILAAFSIEAVSNDFYNAFEPEFRQIAEKVEGTDNSGLKQDFALLFVIRVIFLGFVQKKGWLGENEGFMQSFWQEYRQQFEGQDQFYSRWLEPLFFEALKSPPGRKVKYRNNEFSLETEAVLQQAPFLNGELFKRKKDVDDCELWLPDAVTGDFIEFLFSYNFTIEENDLYDEELELNPEFLGIIFERLVNKADGAVYTPRTEVDFMCRMALVKWLEKNSEADKRDLYHLFFREGGSSEDYDEMQKHGDFSTAQIRELISLLENVSVCDPAAGSGAFEVGMLHVLNEVMANLLTRHNTPQDISRKTAFERKKNIIANSLYGVEVKRWAVWINQLRLWLTLFIDMPDEYRNSFEPLLPSLNFKVRCGDSLVQRIGSKAFPVHEHAYLPSPIKRKITELKKLKVDFFHNRGKNDVFIRQQETNLFREILDEEKRAKRDELLAIGAPRDEQLDMLGDDPRRQQLYLQTISQEKEKIKTEIAELDEQKRNLKDDHPLIWNIEFAEIFFDPEKSGGFDIIIGNPPYVRQEDIADPNGNLSPKEYKATLQETVLLDFPHHFGKSVQEPHVFKKDRKPDGKSDLYVYFYLRSLHLLNPKGVHVFICSNSWLDVGYGAWMQYFLLKNVPVHFIFDNHARRSFANADVNTIISVLGAPLVKRHLSKSSGQVSGDGPQGAFVHSVKFVAFKQPFEEVVLTENLLAIEDAQAIVKNEAFRVYPISADKLLVEGSEFENPEQEKLGIGKYIGDKWGGKYLRAPDIFFTILEKGKGKLVKLKDIADVRFGIKTGCNEFFYLTDEQARRWGIEEEFLKPVIKSPRESRNIILEENTLSLKLFLCNKSKNSLNGYKALKYIEWGEKQGFQEITSVRNRKFWWSIPQKTPLKVLWPMVHNDRLAVFHNPNCVYVDHNLFELSFEVIPLSLFSTFTLFSRELFGRANLGEGGLKTEGMDIKSFLLVDPLLLSNYEISGFNIFKRPILSIFTECGIDPKSDIPIWKQEPKPLPDRAELDKIVFDALELTEEERKEVYRAVCQLVWNRISKAKSVKKRK